MYFTFTRHGNMPRTFGGIEDQKVSWLCDDWLAIANRMAII